MSDELQEAIEALNSVEAELRDINEDLRLLKEHRQELLSAKREAEKALRMAKSDGYKKHLSRQNDKLWRLIEMLKNADPADLESVVAEVLKRAYK